jgi:hypothetical protein
MTSFRHLDQDRLFEAIRMGVADGIFRIATNGSDMPTADFFEAIEKGVRVAVEGMDLESVVHESNRVASPPERRGYSIDEVAALGVLGKRGTIYRLIAAGALKARKVGKRTIIMSEDITTAVDKLQRMGAAKP